MTLYIILIIIILLLVIIIYNNKVNYNNRLKWYLGKYYNTKYIVSSNDFLIDLSTIENKKEEKYYKELYKYFWNKKNKYILFQPGDVKDNYNMPVLTKSRPINSDNIILLFNFERHWDNVYKLRNQIKDISFQSKKPIAFWRGTTTGSEDRAGNRFNLMTKWFNQNSKIDIAFSDITQGKSEYSKYVKNKADIQTFLQYKYIISIEGNDVSSGLKWNLLSNSIVLMPKPTMVSWFMENHLLPFIHYIPIKNDWSDLEKMIDWCENNQEKCKYINYNAKKYVNNFLKEFDSGRHLKIINDIIKIYSNNITFNIN